MPTINEVIERVERIRPVVSIDDQDKARWLMELDRRIWNEVLGKSEHDTQPEDPLKKWPEDGDKQLLVSHPYDRLYDLYLIAMLEFSIREYGSYNNTMTAFNDALDKFACHHRGTHMPVSRGDFQHVFP